MSGRESSNNELTPLVAEPPSGPAVVQTVGLGLAVICLSVGLINFNNYLMEEGRFPYAAPLVLIHMGFCSVFGLILFWLCPSLFPSLTDPGKKVTMDWHFLTRGVVPIGAFFATSLVLGNMAYEQLGLAFLQMLKETGIIQVYALSLVFGLETFSCRQVQVIALAVLGASLTIKGELHFNMLGFIMQLTGQFCECCRITLQSFVLSGHKLDALSYVLVVSPICFGLLGIVVGIVAIAPAGTFGSHFVLPSVEVISAWAPVLLLNCMVAFTLNVSIALLIKHTSAMSYIFCGVLKDIVAVLVSVFVLHELVSKLQVAAFTIQVTSVLAWSLMKSKPENFERGLFTGLALTICGGRGLLAAGPTKGGKPHGAEEEPPEATAAHDRRPAKDV